MGLADRHVRTLRSVAVWALALAAALGLYARVRDLIFPPRQYYPVQVFLCRLCVTPDSITVLREEGGQRPFCFGADITADVQVIRSIPMRCRSRYSYEEYDPRFRQPPPEVTAKAGPERAVVVRLRGSGPALPDTTNFSYMRWDSESPRKQRRASADSSLQTEAMPPEMVARILPALADEMVDQGGEELAAAVRAGGIPISSLPSLQIGDVALYSLALGLFAVSFIARTLARRAQRAGDAGTRGATGGSPASG